MLFWFDRLDVNWVIVVFNDNLRKYWIFWECMWRMIGYDRRVIVFRQ